jgi:hypothetical protein
MTRARVTLLLAHLIGNAVLLWLGYYWLGLDESDAKHLAGSVAVLLLLTVGGSTLHGIALAHFSGLSPRQAARRSARNIIPLAALSLLTLAMYGGMGWASEGFGRIAYVVSSSATMTLRRPVPPSTPQRVLQTFFWLLRWVGVPAVLLPLAAAISLDGWRGWHWRVLRQSKRWLYWLQVAAFLLCAIWIPFKLFFWVPRMAPFGGQMASFILRAGLGYLLFVTAALVLEFFTCSGKPRETQPSTVASP